MRVWFLKETKSICTSCATGCNTVIGSRENIVYRQTPRENNDVNSVWMCDYGRLNFHYLHSPERLTNPTIKAPAGNEITQWEVALGRAATELKALPRRARSRSSPRAARPMRSCSLPGGLSEALGDHAHRHHPAQRGGGQNPAQRGPQRQYRRGATHGRDRAACPARCLALISSGLKNRTIKALIVLGEDATKVLGEEIANARAHHRHEYSAERRPRNWRTWFSRRSGFAEKRGSMINKKGRLQRLNRAIQPPGAARDDWEIIRDLLQGISGDNGIYMIEDVFRQMAAAIPALAGLSLSKIGDLGVQLNLNPNLTDHCHLKWTSSIPLTGS